MSSFLKKYWFWLVLFAMLAAELCVLFFSRAPWPAWLCIPLSLAVATAGGLETLRQRRALRDLRRVKAELEIQLEDAQTSVRERYLKGILQGELPPVDRLPAFLERYDIHFESDYFCVACLISVDESAFFPDTLEGPPPFYYMVELRRILLGSFSQALSSLTGFHMVNIDGQLVGILPILDLARAEADLQKFMSDLEECLDSAIRSLERDHGVVFRATVSAPLRGIYSLDKAFAEAQGLAEYGFKDRSVVSVFTQESTPEERQVSLRRMNFERQFYNCIASQDFLRAGELLVQRLKEEGADPSIPIQWLRNEQMRRLEFMLRSCNQTLRLGTEEGQDLLQYLLGVRESRNLPEMCAQMISFCAAAQKMWDAYMQTSSDRAGQIAAYIQENYQNANLNATMICEAFDLSLAYVSRMFKQRMGMGVLEYIHRIRVTEAKKYMKTDMNLDEIANKVGYYSRRTLTQAFKRCEGITPDAYRKHLLQ